MDFSWIAGSNEDINVTICPSTEDIVENYEFSLLSSDTDQTLLYADAGILIDPLSFSLLLPMTDRT